MLQQVRYSVLGPVRAWQGHREVDLGWPKQRAVLTVLLLNPNRLVARDAIIDGIWGDEPPRSAVSLVHTYVRGLRQALEPDRRPRAPSALLARRASGYALRLEAGQLDLHDFETRTRHASALYAAGDLGQAVGVYTDALALWSGPPLAGIPGPLADAQRVRLAGLQLAAIEDRAEAMLGLGMHAELAGDLSALAAELPLRERMLALLMTALYHCGRQSEALAAYTRTRMLLAEGLGIDPCPELRRLHQQILAGDLPEPTLAKTAGRC